MLSCYPTLRTARLSLWRKLVRSALTYLLGGIVGILRGRGSSEAVTALLDRPTIPSLSAIIVAVAALYPRITASL